MLMIPKLHIFSRKYLCLQRYTFLMIIKLQRYELINCVATRDGPILSYGARVGHFRDKTNWSSIELTQEITIGKESFNSSAEV